MTSITPTSAAIRARAGLHAAIVKALKGERVDISRGFVGKPQHPDWVALGDVDVSADVATIGPRRSRDETVTLKFNVGAFDPGHNDKAADAAWSRVDALLGKITTYVEHADNTTLGGVVAWALAGNCEWVGEELEEGYQVEVAAEIICSHRVRAV